MRRLGRASLLAAMGLVVAMPAMADTLTINGSHGDTWTLDVQDPSCTSGCTLTLTADLGSDSFFDDSFVDAVQFKVDGSDPLSAEVTDFTVNGTTAGTPGTDWDTAVDASLSGGNQCNGGGADNVCSQYITAAGFGALSSGDVLEWTFLVGWTSIADTLTGGNIRASFNDNTGKNIYTFSPEGGTFEGNTESNTESNVESNTESNVESSPEPATLVLFGSGLAIAAARLRQRRQGKNA